MQTPTFASLLLVAGLCHAAQQFPDYVEFEGNRSSPNSLPPGVRNTLERADTNPNASHTVSFRSPGYGDWDWTLQLSDVSVPAISNSTPDAHVAFSTWHFSEAGERRMLSKRAEDSPLCAYLMDINFPYNVSSQWDPNDSSCVPALGEECASALGAVRTTGECDSMNAALPLTPEKGACAGMLSGGPAEDYGINTQGYAFNARNVTDGAWGYAITKPYEGFNETAYQVEAERLRIMVFTGPKGSELVCNRVAQSVEIGAEDAEDKSEGGSEDSKSGASGYSSHIGGLAMSIVASCLAAYWL